MRSIIIKAMNKRITPSQARRAGARRLALAGLLAVVSVAGRAGAEPATIALKIHNHEFHPAEIELPAGEKRQLLIENQDATAEEFESHTLHREKIVPPLSTINLFIGPLKPGRYEFFGEFNAATAKGAVVVK
jgi:plastocyanin